MLHFEPNEDTENLPQTDVHQTLHHWFPQGSPLLPDISRLNACLGLSSWDWGCCWSMDVSVDLLLAATLTIVGISALLSEVRYLAVAAYFRLSLLYVFAPLTIEIRDPSCSLFVPQSHNLTECQCGYFQSGLHVISDGNANSAFQGASVSTCNTSFRRCFPADNICISNSICIFHHSVVYATHVEKFAFKVAIC